MVATAGILVAEPDSSGASQFSPSPFTPTGDAVIVVFANALLYDTATIAMSIASSPSLTWIEQDLSANWADSGVNGQCGVWTAVAPSSPAETTVTLTIHDTQIGEAGIAIGEIVDGNPTTPFDQLSATIVGSNGEDGASGISETTDTISTPSSGLTLTGWSFEHNTYGSSPSPTWDSPPSGWSVVTDSTVEGASSEWFMGQWLESSGSGTSATHGITGETQVYNRGMFIAEIASGSVAILVQDGFRWGTDDGSESAHGWEAAEDTDPTTLPPETTKLLRVQVDEDGGAEVIDGYKLQYRRDDEGTSEWRDVT